MRYFVVLVGAFYFFSSTLEYRIYTITMQWITFLCTPSLPHPQPHQMHLADLNSMCVITHIL